MNPKNDFRNIENAITSPRKTIAISLTVTNAITASEG